MLLNVHPDTLQYKRWTINIHSHLENWRERPSDIGNLQSCQFDTCIEKHQAQAFKSDTIAKDTFLQFSNVSKAMKFCGVPYSKVKELLYVSEKPFHTLFKTSFADKEFTEVSISGQKNKK